ncbi:hypothetical protein HBI56_188540 [Parastagonospora nodorum]|uniref:Uncharacterized protein n=1 Tax=Phaeosphaeria nodorum (strain SN15 / ATCC MYA-4574 / FGSC 10173) TaxID=321614 RepID=A0A7U2F9P2_PHANO|nr:hypothetical protein HBH56_145950 [Parastagonospora nodorum]QRD01298.1 hypothetical protein JI435_416380 [Parastagonospora nodorum SN15]KAH3927870.1 hypothetical protein HBH54_151140 [Parastagonospora nodorum]KAH3947817.1 hypothetical protein HBH53_111160 [Parastagonospora nodorum]KAH3960180.1 hypothetical protein HBH51_195000 [Parastagonospora nodorum]
MGVQACMWVYDSPLPFFLVDMSEERYEHVVLACFATFSFFVACCITPATVGMSRALRDCCVGMPCGTLALPLGLCEAT